MTCTYAGALYSEGSITCQGGTQCRCEANGTWQSLNVSCDSGSYPTKMSAFVYSEGDAQKRRASARVAGNCALLYSDDQNVRWHLVNSCAQPVMVTIDYSGTIEKYRLMNSGNGDDRFIRYKAGNIAIQAETDWDFNYGPDASDAVSLYWKPLGSDQSYGVWTLWNGTANWVAFRIFATGGQTGGYSMGLAAPATSNNIYPTFPGDKPIFSLSDGKSTARYEP